MNFKFIFIFFCVVLYAQSSSAFTDSSFVIMVQPIIVQGDEGEEPASMALPEKLVDKAYSKANIDFVFFEPIFYNNTKARDGEISLDQIVDHARGKELIRGNGDIVNMFFVNRVDGKSGPLGRGLFGGNITFIALGKSNSDDQRFMEAFVIAHEIGHNLGLNHAIQDPNVPDSIPNIQGGGSFEDRINPINSLNNYQINEIHKSSLVTRKIDFLSVERGKVGILDESFEPYFSILQEREIYAFTQEWPGEGSMETKRDFAREKFQSAVIEFSSKEKECIRFVIKNIDSVFGENDINLFAHFPWRFIKVDNWLCGGYAHTRGTYTILSQRYLDRYTSKFGPNMSVHDKQYLVKHLGGLLIHEQLHALQRTSPAIFLDLYTNYWSFENVNIIHDVPQEIKPNQLLNPDAPNANWVYNNNERRYWPRVLINDTASNPVMGKDFISAIFDIERRENQYFIQLKNNREPKTIGAKRTKQYMNAFPVSSGSDHPNEISAYMYSEYFKALITNEQPFLMTKESARLNAELFLNWLSKNEHSSQLPINN